MLTETIRRSRVFFSFLLAIAVFLGFSAPSLYSFSDLGIVVEQFDGTEGSGKCPHCGRPVNAGAIHTDAPAIVREKLKVALTDRNTGYSDGAREGQPYINVFIYRFQERRGGNFAVERPAAVAFHMHLMKDNVVGKVFVYSEEQKALTQNLFTMGKFFRRGARWVTADELAEEGVYAGLNSLLGEMGGFAETGQ